MADTGWIEVQIDRFDTLTGWQFNRLYRLRAPGGTVTWIPPAAGRWRARASYLGTLRFSPSRSGYVFVLVATPLPPKTHRWAVQGSNLRPPACKAGALPAELTARAGTA